MNFLKNLFDNNTKVLKKIQPQVNLVLGFENTIKKLSGEELKQKTTEFKNRLQNGETLDDLLVEAFAVCREASWRAIGLKHFPVQITGGIMLHKGNIAEMKTGEGKTLVLTLPAYLNALTGKVHVVTVNDYLARRDKEWMGKVFESLGLSVGLIYGNQPLKDKRNAYSCDIIYGTNSEFGFDYLRDHMVSDNANKVQKELGYAIVDEVDSVLIDEARTPLIISSPTFRSPKLYIQANQFIKTLIPEDYTLTEKEKTISLTEQGVTKAERFFKIDNFGDLENVNINHHVNIALKAHFILNKDIDYITKDNKIVIINQFTGRLDPGKRYSNGIHQALEAKEDLEINPENAVNATITYQNYFRLYKKLAGMTGTARTEEEEFQFIYGLDVIVIPTNKPMIREDYDDIVFKTENEKWNAIVEDIKQHHEKKQPVLVGTTDVEKSEYLSFLLKRGGVPHQILNAKNHEKEAYIIAQAGRLAMVTIATNMAGRGTDILLGGNPQMLTEKEFGHIYNITIQEVVSFIKAHENIELQPEVKEIYYQMVELRRRFYFMLDNYKSIAQEEKEKTLELGGLYVIGTERHEARRIDNQLRGRTGRQGDPGKSCFYLSLEDKLLRLFGGERVKSLAETMKLEEDTPISSNLLSGIIENAQKKLEEINFCTRKNLLNFDNIMNIQRNLVYKDRDKILNSDEDALLDNLCSMVENQIKNEVTQFMVDNPYPEEWNLEKLQTQIERSFNLQLSVKLWDRHVVTQEDIANIVYNIVKKEIDYILENMEFDKRLLFLQRVFILSVDSSWKEHIDNVDQLKRGIGLRGYGHENPFQAFQNETYKMYNQMLSDIQTNIIQLFFNNEGNQEKVS
ncbi:MAG: preprotein translocase subunit SecA [Candidatus Pacebacteria bacterium]|nr:preprotein translocase subunit SecA [Candidatus Paceibacterota bacterium]